MRNECASRLISRRRSLGAVAWEISHIQKEKKEKMKKKKKEKEKGVMNRPTGRTPRLNERRTVAFTSGRATSRCIDLYEWKERKWSIVKTINIDRTMGGGRDAGRGRKWKWKCVRKKIFINLIGLTLVRLVFATLVLCLLSLENEFAVDDDVAKRDHWSNVIRSR